MSEESAGRFVVKVDVKADPLGLPKADPDTDPSFSIKAGLGYVEIDGGPTCGNCEYQKDGKCVHPFTAGKPFSVDLERGCCSRWKADDSPEGEAAQDWEEAAQATEED